MESEQISFWRTDVTYLAEHLRSHHANLYHTISQRQFDQAVADLIERVPELESHEVIIEMARIVAMIGDGHTSFRLDTNTSLPFRRYSLKFYEFSDGIVVYETDETHRAYLGARLAGVGDESTDAIMSRVESVVAGDNTLMRRTGACAALNIPEVLHALKVIPEMENATFHLEQPDGERVTVKFAPLERDAIQWINLADNATPLALWRKYPDLFYWFEYLESNHLVYMNHRVVRDADDETFAAFCERLFNFIETHPVERFVIDIRTNGGGNNQLNQPLIHGLICCKKINQLGKLFTIIGRHTFSAAMNLAVDLERNTKTSFVGEPTGASPNHYGETFYITLPHSAITLTLATLYWQSSTPDDHRPWIEPQIPISMSSTDYRNNIDPVLDAILAYK